MSDVPTFDPPRLLDDRYRLDGLAGVGGMGRVHRAWDTRLGRRVAIKMLAPELAADPDVSARLRAEGRHLASIAHPNLVALYDLSADGATPYLVMELIDGKSLAERLRRDGPLPAREVAAIVTGVAAGLSALHGAGIVHRDVSPANILLGRDGRPRLADLGLAHQLDRPEAVPASGMIHGTLHYLAPELLDRAPATPASDVYALAAVTYAALLGRPPAVAADVVKLRAAHREPPIRPSLLRPGLDPALDEVLLRALGPAAVRPTAYAFAVAIANALRACDDPVADHAGSGPSPAGPVGVAYRSRRRRIAPRSSRRVAAALGAGALVLTLAGAALATIDHALERPTNPALVAGLAAASPRPATLTVDAEHVPVSTSRTPVATNRPASSRPAPATAIGPGTDSDLVDVRAAIAASLSETLGRMLGTGRTGSSAAPGRTAVSTTTSGGSAPTGEDLRLSVALDPRPPARVAPGVAGVTGTDSAPRADAVSGTSTGSNSAGSGRSIRKVAAGDDDPSDAKAARIDRAGRSDHGDRSGKDGLVRGERKDRPGGDDRDDRDDRDGKD